jgi:hypothetical protein
MPDQRSPVRRRWRHYETAVGRRPVLAFLRARSDADKAGVLAAMQEVRSEGLRVARHLRDDDNIRDIPSKA